MYYIQACEGSGRIYIRSLVPGGAAEGDGRLHAGNAANVTLIEDDLL